MRRALCAGYFRHAARRDTGSGAGGGGGGGGVYKTVVGGTRVGLDPASVLWGKAERAEAEWVVYHELVLTASGEYVMRGVTAVEPGWLVDAAPGFWRLVGAGGGVDGGV